MKKQGKILLLVLSFVLIFAALAVIVGASDTEKTSGASVNGVKYATFDDAFTAATETGGTITLLGDTEIEDSYEITSDITIDLAGYQLDVYEKAFVVSGTANFTVKGTGTINAYTTFIESASSLDQTNVTIGGTDAPMYVSFYGEGGNPFALIRGGNCTFQNLEMISHGVLNNKTVFGTTDDCKATVTFNNVNVVGEGHLGQQSYLIEIRGKALFKLNNSSFTSNTAVVKVSTTNTAMMLEADNSKLINHATDGTDKANETGVIGVYSDMYGQMYFKNSLIEGGYRPILVKGKATGLITLDGSVLKHTQAKSSSPIRTSNMLFINGSYFIVGRTITSLSDMSEYKSNIDLEVGTRLSFYVYDLIAKGNTPELRIAVKEPGVDHYTYVPYDEDCDYTIVYDPIGDADVPYVIVDKYEKNEDGSYKIGDDGKRVECDYPTYNMGTIVHYSTGASLPEGLIWKDQKYSFQFDSSYEFPDTGYLKWNSAGGSFIGYTYGGNSAVKYLRGSNKSQNCLNFTTTQTKYNSAPVMVFEIDFATDSALGFANGTISVNIRNASAGSGGVNDERIRIQDDKATFDSNPDVKYDLDRSTWHKITVVFYTDTTVTENQLTAATSGKSYYYLDGMLIGEGVAYKKDAGIVYGLRYDTIGSTKEGTSILFDNISVRKFDSYTNVGESLANPTPNAYLMNGGKALDMPLGPMGVYSVSGKRYDTLDAAIDAADSIGTYITLLDNVTDPINVTKPCVIFANGYTMNLTDDSMAASVTVNPDGSNYKYIFSERFNGLKAKYEWFVGDMNSAEDLKNPEKYITTTVSIGEIPKFTGSAFEVENKSYVTFDDAYSYTHIGWSREIGSSVAETLVPLSASDAINNKEASIKLFPVFGYEKLNLGYTWVVTDTDGNLLYDESGNVRGGTQNGKLYKGFWTDNVKLSDGETIHLLADMTACSIIFFEDPSDAALPYGFNLNGHTLTVNGTLQNYGYGNRIEGVFSAKEGTALNVYSSIEGGVITALGYKNIKTTFTATPDHDSIDHSKNDYTITGGMIFRMNANNSTLNVGSVTVGSSSYSGTNLTIMGDCLAYTKWGTGVEMNFNDITFIRTSSEYPAVIETSQSNSVINVEGSEFILAAGGAFVGNDDAGKTYSARTNLNSSLIVMKNNGDNLVSKNTGTNAIYVNGCLTNATLNAGANTVIGEGTAAYASSFTADEGLRVVKSSVSMSLSSLSESGALKVWVYNTSGVYNNLETEEYIISETSTLGADLVLPTLSFAAIAEEDAIAYTFLGLGTNEAKVVYYAKGTLTDAAPEIDSCDLTYLKLVHTGEFDSRVPRYAEESCTFTPLYTIESTLEGFKTSVTLYTDFVVNLYVPGEYETAITEMLVNGEKTEYTAVELDGESYLKLSVRTIPSKLADGVEFTFTISDSEYVATSIVTTSVGSYAESVLASSGGYTLAEKKLVYAMLVYVNEAGIYANGNSSPELEALIEAYASVGANDNDLTPPLDNVPMENEMLSVMNDNALLTTIIQTARVRLSSAPAFIFTLRRGFVGTVNVTIGGVTREYNVEAPKDRTITIDGVNADSFGKIVYITAVGTMDGETVEIVGAKYNLATYLQYHLDNVALEGEIPTESQLASEKALPVIKALLSYVIAADEYRDSLLEAPDESVDSSDEFVPEGDTPLGDVFIDG